VARTNAQAEGVIMEWFKLWNDGVLRGSLSRADDVIQLIWVKLLAVENETRARDGWLHYAPGKPMDHVYLATVCGVSLDWFEEALRQFQNDLDQEGHPRIVIAKDGDIFLRNWDHYQARSDKGEDKAGLDSSKLYKELQQEIGDGV